METPPEHPPRSGGDTTKNEHLHPGSRRRGHGISRWNVSVFAGTPPAKPLSCQLEGVGWITTGRTFGEAGASLDAPAARQ
jgi:hypothetical protein